MVGPAEPTVNDIKKFLQKSMEVPLEVVEDLEISGIKKHPPKKPP